MTIIVYQCDTCKRENEIRQNKKGLESLTRCNITHGCRGQMFQTEVHPDFLRGKRPDDVVGLDNWIQRKVLYNHKQGVERDVWKITHGLGSSVTVNTFVDRPTEATPDNQEEIIPTTIKTITNNCVELTFDRAWSGVAQLVANASNPDILVAAGAADDVTSVDSFQISASSEITIATLSTATNINVTLTFSTATGIVEHTYPVGTGATLPSPWSDATTVLINHDVFTVRSFSITNPNITNGTIGNGATFEFNNSGVATDEVPILLTSNEPHTVFDKSFSGFVDSSDIDAALGKNPFGFVYDSGEANCTSSAITATYPPIRPLS